MPACFGCVLLFVGCRLLSATAPRLRRMRLSTILLFVVSLSRTTTEALAWGGESVWLTLAHIAEMLLALHLAYETAEHVKELEKDRARPLGGKDLSSAWFLLALGNLLTLFAGRMESMALLCLVLQILSIIWYQVSLWRAYGKISNKRKK